MNQQQHRWQYQVIDIRHKLFGTNAQQVAGMQEEFNRQGQQGWELVSLLLVPGSMSYRASFKRAC